MQKYRGHVSVGFLGLIGVIVFSLGWLMGTLLDTSWVFGENMLSDLGGPDSEAKQFFNFGCFFGGMFVMVAGIGMTSIRSHRIYALTGVMTAIVGVLLALIGLFPTDTGDIHLIFAIGLFAIAALAMITMTGGDWKYGHVLTGGITILFLAVIILVFLMESLEFAEAVAVIVFLLWFTMTVLKVSTIKERIVPKSTKA